MRVLNLICVILLIIGGLNWGLVGVFKWDIVAAIFGDLSIISRIIYILVGLCAIWRLVFWPQFGARGSKAPQAA